MSLAHSGHLWVPSDPANMQILDDLEYSRTQKSWKRPWVYGGQQILPGKHLMVRNEPFRTEKGEAVSFDPLQVACFALQKAQAGGCDVITVVTPSYTDASGSKALARCQFKVQDLVRLDRSDPSLFPEIKNGTITLEQEALMTLPPRWTVNENNLFVPTV